MLPRKSLAIRRCLYLIQLAVVLSVLVIAELHRLAAQHMHVILMIQPVIFLFERDTIALKMFRSR